MLIDVLPHIYNIGGQLIKIMYYVVGDACSPRRHPALIMLLSYAETRQLFIPYQQKSYQIFDRPDVSD